MAITTAVWNENNTLRSAATITAGASATHDLDINDDGTIGGSDLIVLQFNIALSTSSGVTVEIFSSPNSGTTEDDVSLPGGFTVTADVIKTTVVMAHPYIAVKITNDDGSNATGNISILYAARTWDTT